MGYYTDIHDYLETLEKRGKLIRVKREINKDTQMHPLMRLQFRGLPEEERKGFLFENVIDSRGRKHNIPVACSVLAGSKDIYAIGMMCQPEEIAEKLAQAQLHPIEPRLVSDGPVQEVVFIGDTLLLNGGLDEFPIPISTPGYDIAPFAAGPGWVTKDPDTGIRNIGTYRAQLKTPTRLGVCWSLAHQDMRIHWEKCRQRGVPLQAALVVGGAPNIGYTSVSKLSPDVDEFAVAGGIAGKPVELVKCKTVDLEVPAHAEIVIEGEFTIKELEPEAPFGEGLGYMGLPEMMPYFTVTCITRRKNPIWLCFIAQFPPGEHTKIRQQANEGLIYKHLRYELNMSHVLTVAFHEPSSSGRLVVIKMKKTEPAEVWRTLEATRKRWGARAKFIIAVDEDIDPWDLESVVWALSFRLQPHRDCRIDTLPADQLMDYSLVSAEELDRIRDARFPTLPDTSCILMDATLKWPYPPISLPKKEFMDDALRIWQEEGLPPLKLKQPWWGYNLGYWNDEYEELAMDAVKGEYYRAGEIQAKRRKAI